LNPKLNVRQGAAGSRGNGGGGKPGYPLPDNLKNNLAPVEEDLLSLSPVDFSVSKKQHNDSDFVKKSDVLDIVVKSVISKLLGEGGAAVKGDRIEKKDIAPTLEKFSKEVLSKLKHKWAGPIGSTGKKSTSGDIDIGFDSDLSIGDVEKIVDDLGLENKAMKGLGVISIKFPQVDSEQQENGKHVQIDLMFGPREWIEFAFYSPSEGESQYSGVQARALFIAMMKAVTGHSVSPARGFFTSGDKSKDKKYMNDPKQAAALLSAKSSEQWSVDDLNQPFEKIWLKAKKSFTPEQIEQVKNTMKEFMGSIKKPVPKELDEASRKGMPTGIQHLEDLNYEDFVTFLEKYQSLELDGGLEVSEKVDGSAALVFGVENGKLWTQSKKGMKFFSSSQYGDKPMFKPLRMAHEALQSKSKEIIGAWPKDIEFMTGEILYTKIPNTIEYGPNVIMIHGVQKKDGSVISDEESRKLATAVTTAAHGKLNDGQEEWKFEYKRIIPNKDVMLDVKNEYDSLGDVLKRLRELEPNKLKKDGKGPYKAALESFKAIQLAVKKKLLTQLRKQKSVYGPEGGAIEGIVFRDLDSGGMVKLVDKDLFSKLNQFLWSFRNDLDRGNKVGDKMELGVFQKFLQNVGKNVIGSEDIRLTTFVSRLKKIQDEIQFPENVDTAEKKADYTLAYYIKKNNLMSGDYILQFEKAVADAKKNYDEVKASWDKRKQDDINYEIKDDEGNVVKTVKMDKLIKDRTDTSYEEMGKLIDSMKSTAEVIKGMSNDDTKKTALLKLVMGQNRFNKLVGNADDEEQANESIAILEKDDVSDKKFDHERQVLNSFKEKLASKGMNADSMKELGSGNNGSVFELSDGRVLKITKDDSEARTANHLKGKKLKHVIFIHDVFAFPIRRGVKWYGIVEDKAEPLQDEERFDSATKDVIRSVTADGEVHHNPWTMSWGLIKKKALHNAWDEEVTQENLDYLEELRFPDLMKELEKNRVNYSDVHGGNFMMKNGVLVLVDLGGRSESPGKPPNVLEKKLREEQHKEIPAILKKFADKLEKKGIKIKNETPLGSGSRGQAFETQDGKVLKITNDASEAKASMKLKDSNSEHLTKVLDVFKFNLRVGNREFFGILQEKLDKLSHKESFELERAIDNSLLRMISPGKIETWETFKSNAENIIDRHNRDKEKFLNSLKILEKFNVDKIMDELYQARIHYTDYHAGNFMKRGDKYVLIDLGYSKSEGAQEPPILERIAQMSQNSLREATSDQVGVTIGRFQPFHAGHAEIIRNLTKKFNKVIVIIAGNSKEKKNPFSFELRKEIMKKSLPDVFSKLEIHKAEIEGKGSGFIPGIISELVGMGKTKLTPDTAFHVLVGEDRIETIKKQFDLAKNARENKGIAFNFDLDAVMIQALPDVKNDDDSGRVSGTKVREALASDNKEEVKKLMDPHLVSNESDFEKIYSELKNQLSASQPVKKKEKVTEALSTYFDKHDVEDVVTQNEEELKKRGIEVGGELGSGKDGVAYQVNNNRALKVTTDVGEAQTALKIISSGKNLKHVVHFFDVFRFRKGVKKNIELFGIVTERLTKLSRDEEEKYDFISAFWLTDEKDSRSNQILDAIREGNYDKLLNIVYEVFLEAERKGDPLAVVEASTAPTAKHGVFRKNPSQQKAPQIDKKPQGIKSIAGRNPEDIANRKFDVYKKTAEHFKLREMIQDLKSLGIEFSDFHSGNVMKRGNDYVINDLGRSGGGLDKSGIKHLESKNPDDVLESITEMVISELGAMNGYGFSQTGLNAGSSAVSRFKNRVDPDSEELWQNQLSRVSLKNPNSDLQEDNQEMFSSGEVDSQKLGKLEEEKWIKWSEKTDTVDFDLKKRAGSGRGEAKLAAELELRGYDVKEESEGKGEGSFDLLVNGKRWEVKEFKPIRIETTGQKQIRTTLNFFYSFSESIKQALEEIKTLNLGEDVFKIGKLNSPSLEKFAEKSMSAVTNGNVPVGLSGFSKSAAHPNYLEVAKALDSFIKESEKAKKSGKLKISLGDGQDAKDLFSGDMDISDIKYLMKMLKKSAPQGSVSDLNDIGALQILESSLTENGINKTNLTQEVVNHWKEAFDPEKILGEDEKIIIVDKEKGFFIMQPKDLLKWYGPAGISKSTQQLRPRKELKTAGQVQPQPGEQKPKKPKTQGQATSKKTKLPQGQIDFMSPEYKNILDKKSKVASDALDVFKRKLSILDNAKKRKTSPEELQKKEQDVKKAEEEARKLFSKVGLDFPNIEQT